MKRTLPKDGRRRMRTLKLPIPPLFVARATDATQEMCIAYPGQNSRAIMAENICVFVVEDEEAILHMLEAALADSGFSIVMASSGEEAIRMLALDASNYKALITDINLSGKVTGWDVGRYAREVNDRIPVVYMTGASAHDWASKGVPNSLLMPKPFALAQVVTAVSQLVNEAANSL